MTRFGHARILLVQIEGTVWQQFDKELGGTEMKPGDDQSLLDTNYITDLMSSVSLMSSFGIRFSLLCKLRISHDFFVIRKMRPCRTLEYSSPN